MAWCPQSLSVRMWMTCLHLPPYARTRWVTERIASTESAPESKDEITGSSSALRNGLARQWSARRRNLGTKTFLPVDTRPNG